MALNTIPVSQEVIAAVITLVAGLAGAYRYYRRTGKLPLATLPWRAFRKLFYTLRVEFATKGRPNTKRDLPGTLDEITDELAIHSYEPGWPLSYHYHGEDVNLRRYYYDPDAEYPHRQMHVRLWERKNGSVFQYTHDEPSAIHHPKAHIRDKNMKDATEWFAEAYDGKGGRSLTLDPRCFDPDDE